MQQVLQYLVPILAIIGGICFAWCGVPAAWATWKAKRSIGMPVNTAWMIFVGAVTMFAYLYLTYGLNWLLVINYSIEAASWAVILWFHYFPKSEAASAEAGWDGIDWDRAGGSAEQEVPKMKRYVTGFMFDRNGENLAVVRKNKPEWQRGKLNGIGGKIEPGESPEQAMIREFKEETGVEYDEWLPFVRLYREGEYEVYFFLAFTERVHQVQTVEAEQIYVVPVGSGIWANCIPNLRWLLPMALDPYVGKRNWIHVEDVGGN